MWNNATDKHGVDFNDNETDADMVDNSVKLGLLQRQHTAVNSRAY